jgi:hypothetical protein
VPAELLEKWKTRAASCRVRGDRKPHLVASAAQRAVVVVVREAWAGARGGLAAERVGVVAAQWLAAVAAPHTVTRSGCSIWLALQGMFTL